MNVQSISYEVLKELLHYHFLYDSTIKDCIAYLCYRKKLELSEEEKQQIFVRVKEAFGNITKEEL